MTQTNEKTDKSAPPERDDPTRKRWRKRTWLLLSMFAVTGVTVTASFLREPAYRPPHAGRLAAGAAHGVGIAPVGEALTFARYRDAGRLRLIRVERYRDGIVEGVRLDGLVAGDGRADPVTLLGHADYRRIAIADGARVRLADTALELPFDGTASQIAIGGNYPLHKEETTLVESFLFPKLLAAGRFDSTVAVRQGLLDYEIELGFVPLGTTGQGPAIGLVLATDYTDREMLLRRLKLGDVPSGEGFTDAKSRAGYMPVGNLFVVPRDVDRFYRTLDLQLFVNGALRQIAPPRAMVWDLEEILRRSVAAADRRWAADGGIARLPVENGHVLPRTIILSGTTDGVVFRPPSARQLALGGIEALLTPWRARDAIVGASIREAKRERRYLQPRDEVVGRADMLGIVRNRITP